MEQNHLRALHGSALSPDLSPKDSLDQLKQVYAGYSTSFDRARAVRDMAKYKFRMKDSSWKRSCLISLDLLENARAEDQPYSEGEILREEAASHAMYGRLGLASALESDVSSLFIHPLEQLESAQTKLRQSAGRRFRPDQYEINFVAARVIAERYSPTSKRGFKPLARAVLIAWTSESSFVRFSGNLPKEDRKAARKRGLARTAFAAKIAFGSHKYVWSEETRQKAAELVA